MSDTKQENNAFPWISAFIRVHPRLSLLRTVNGYDIVNPEAARCFQVLMASYS